jgi:subtilisin family serine protease
MLRGVFLSAVTILFVASLAGAGTIQPPLDEMIAGSQAGEFTGVVLVMADRVDNHNLNMDLKSRRVTLAERHYEVVTTLMQKATDTQGPVLEVLNQLEASGQVREIRPFWISNMIAFEGTPTAIEQAAALEEVEKIIFDAPVETIEPIINDTEPPLVTTRSQGLDVINAPEVWAMGYTGQGRLVSNIDTGVDGSHPAFANRWRGVSEPASECWFDPVNGYTFPTDHGQHGTHTMGTICGRSPTTYDTVGVAINAKWIAAGSVDYGGTTSDIIASFQWIADPDGNPGTTDDVPDCVNNSWGYSPFFHGVPHCDDTFWNVMDGCENAGVVVLFAAGNEGDDYGSNSLRTPADRADTYFNAFSVGAIDGHTPGYPIAGFSSLGPCDCADYPMNIKPECVAPGVDVRSSIPGGSYQGGWNGTSMATPHITGSVALLREINPNLDVDIIKDIFLQSSVDLGPQGEDNTYGHGYLDVYQAALLASGGFGYVEGHVYDSQNNLPIEATVEILGTSISTIANSSGYYIMTVPAEENYTVRGSYHDYVIDEHSVYVEPDQTITQDLYLGPPDISNDPSSYVVSAQPGQIVERDLTISNNGEGGLLFMLSTETFEGRLLKTGGAAQDVTKAQEPLGYRKLERSKNPNADVPYFPPVILDQGGPDAFGHEWIDSDEPGGPSVDWIDISGAGTPVYLGDDDYAGAISIGFSFPFYENNYTSLYIGSNGVLTFGGGNTAYENTGIPNSSAPNNFIALYWDDLNPSSGGSIYYYRDTSNNRFIVSFVGVPFYDWWYGGTGSATFEAVLYPDGDIYLNYATMSPGYHTLSDETIGIENVNASDGLQIVYNASYMHSNLSIFISAGKWLTVSPSAGSVPGPGGSLLATVTFDASDMTEGTYTGRINLDSDDPDSPNIDIPATFNVGVTSDGTIYGTVTDLDSGDPISGVQVYADDGGGNTGSDVTAGDGTYSIVLPPSTYTVSFTHDDYYDATETDVVVTDGGNTLLDVQMEHLPTQDVPTLSQWGMIIMSLLLVVSGTVAVIRRRRPADVPHE